MSKGAFPRGNLWSMSQINRPQMDESPVPPEPCNDAVGGEELTDRMLLHRFQAGSDEAATALYVRYVQRLEQLAHAQIDPAAVVRMDPEGIVQSVFRTFFRRVSGGQYDVGDREDLWKLLLVIALNKIRSTGAFHRAARRSIRRTEPLNADRPPASADSEPQAVSVLRMTIDEIVADLPAGCDEIVRLRIEGFEVGEIARKTGRAKRSVERILQDFRRRLKATLAEDGDGSIRTSQE